jgi:cell division protein FtsB
MTEKTFTVPEEGTNRQFKLVMNFNSSNIDFKLESQDNPGEKYELKNLTLEALQKKNKAYKQFDNTLKIADVISNKIEKNSFVLRTGAVLSLKQTNEYDEEEFIPFEIRKVGACTGSGDSQAELNKLRAENAELKAQLEKLKGGAKPAPSSATKSNGQVSITGTYVPPSMDKNGTIWERIDHCLKLKKDMKKTLDEIFARLNESKKKIDNFVDKAFANNPSPEDKTKALSLITEVLLLRQGFRDVDDYPGIFKNEVKEKGIKFNAEEQEKFDDNMALLGKRFPYTLTPYHQQIDHVFIQVVHNFFKEKNLRFYKPYEIAEVNQLKSKVM